MKRIVSTAALLTIVLAASFAFAHHGPEKVTVTAPEGKQPAVTFDHAAHTKLVGKCETCHHMNKGLTASADKDVKKCSTCHINPKDDAPNMAEMSMQKNPFHMLCVDCHKTEKKGPTKCAECHKKS